MSIRRSTFYRFIKLDPANPRSFRHILLFLRPTVRLPFDERNVERWNRHRGRTFEDRSPDSLQQIPAQMFDRPDNKIWQFSSVEELRISLTTNQRL